MLRAPAAEAAWAKCRKVSGLNNAHHRCRYNHRLATALNPLPYGPSGRQSGISWPPCNDAPPAQFEAAYYRQLEEEGEISSSNIPTLHWNQGGSKGHEGKRNRGSAMSGSASVNGPGSSVDDRHASRPSLPLNGNSGAPAIAETVALACSMVGTIAILSWLLFLSKYGIDFTDEGYYLAWISDPDIYWMSVTQFGFVYHPLYELLNGDIAVLRRVNILITFGLAWAMCAAFFAVIHDVPAFNRPQRLAISAAFASSSLLFLENWLPTPNYNTLALQGLLITGLGLMLAEKTTGKLSVAGCISIGLGGWLAFMAKPTTAAGLAVITAAYLLLARRLTARLIVVTASTTMGFLALSAWLLDGSNGTFVERLTEGSEAIAVLGGGHTIKGILRLDTFPFGKAARLSVLVGTLMVMVAAFLSRKKHAISGAYGATIRILIVTFTLVIILGIGDKVPFLERLPSVSNDNNSPAYRFQSILIAAVPLAAILLSLISYRGEAFAQLRSRWALVPSFILFPFAYVFGGNGNYWLGAPRAGIFWVLAGMVFLFHWPSAENVAPVFLTLGFAVQLITVMVVNVAVEVPYRQPQPLRANDYPVEIGRSGSNLLLTEEFGAYLEAAVAITGQAGFSRGTPVIDMTGQSPGVLYALGAKIIGQPWLLGGYPGSDKFAERALEEVDCDHISKSWILVEPAGPRKLSPNILSALGMDIRADFENVGTLMTPAGSGGLEERRLQHLLKPIRTFENAHSACAAAKSPG